MKYINKLNINFDKWEELNNECIYLLFRNFEKYYLGYIINNDNEYYINLINNKNKIIKFKLFVIENITNNIDIDNINISFLDQKFKNIKNNNILIVGIDINKEDIMSNLNKYSNKQNCEYLF
jgi:hypothetical protein